MDEQGSVERVLAIMAHPDDVDFGAAGTVAQWVKTGISVTYCIVTDGDAGGFDPSVPRAQIPAIRRAEQRAAAAEIGVSDVHFLGYKDGDVTVTQDLRRDISRLIRQVRPQRMLIQSPDRNWDRIPASHPDHLAAGEAAIRAIYPDARNPFAHPELLQDEGLQDWVVPEVWMMASPTPITTWTSPRHSPTRCARSTRMYRSCRAPDHVGGARSHLVVSRGLRSRTARRTPRRVLPDHQHPLARHPNHPLFPSSREVNGHFPAPRRVSGGSPRVWGNHH